MKTFALALLLVLPVCASAQPPMIPPGPAPAPAPPASIDQLYSRILELRAKQAELLKQREDLAKQEAAAVAELKARLKDLVDLGLLDPPAPPVPPKPPAPVPPADPLRAKLAAAYSAAAGTAEQKREQAKDLAALYRAAARSAGDPSLATAGALKAKLTAAANTLVGPDALVEVRKVVAAELVAILGTSEADLTADQRTAVAAVFGRLAGLLDQLGN